MRKLAKYQNLIEEVLIIYLYILTFLLISFPKIMCSTVYLKKVKAICYTYKKYFIRKQNKLFKIYETLNTYPNCTFVEFI